MTFFSAQEDYPVLHDPPDIDSYEESLTVFEKLVKQEQFLLTLVETLDSQVCDQCPAVGKSMDFRFIVQCFCLIG